MTEKIDFVALVEIKRQDFPGNVQTVLHLGALGWRLTFVLLYGTTLDLV